MTVNRRQFLVGAGALGAVTTGGLVRVDAQAAGPVDLGDGFTIRPRADWAGALGPLGPIPAEEPQFLLVHHTVNPNGYAEADVPGLLQGVYQLHTGPEKGWPDVAYNFFVIVTAACGKAAAEAFRARSGATGPGATRGIHSCAASSGTTRSIRPPRRPWAP